MRLIDLKTTAMDGATLSDWYIASVGEESPIWTEEHIDELLNDFYVIPKSTPTIEAEPVRHGKWQPCPIDEANPFVSWFECSVCHSDFEFSEHSIFVGDAEFCLFCGAKMDGDTQ